MPDHGRQHNWVRGLGKVRLSTVRTAWHGRLQANRTWRWHVQTTFSGRLFDGLSEVFKFYMQCCIVLPQTGWVKVPFGGGGAPAPPAPHHPHTAPPRGSRREKDVETDKKKKQNNQIKRRDKKNNTHNQGGIKKKKKKHIKKKKKKKIKKK